MVKSTKRNRSNPRRHHNNKGSRQIRSGKTAKQVEYIARKLGLPFKTKQGIRS